MKSASQPTRIADGSEAWKSHSIHVVAPSFTDACPGAKGLREIDSSFAGRRDPRVKTTRGLKRANDTQARTRRNARVFTQKPGAVACGLRREDVSTHRREQTCEGHESQERCRMHSNSDPLREGSEHPARPQLFETPGTTGLKDLPAEW